MEKFLIKLVEVFEKFLLPMIVLILFVVVTTNVNALDIIMNNIISTILTIIF